MFRNPSTMAINVISILLIAVAFSSVFSAVESVPCKSEKYALCEHLPTLDSEIHYTYNATNASLSIAFIAKPSKPGGWIAWAINPTGTGMVGSQTFVAYEFNNSVRVKTLNIIDYEKFIPGNLSFPYWDFSTEKRNGSIALYASLAVPGNKTKVNQVWQVGPGTEPDGKIMSHTYKSENLASKSVLSLTGALTPEPAPHVAPAPGKSKSSGGRLEMSLSLGLVVSLVTLCFI